MQCTVNGETREPHEPLYFRFGRGNKADRALRQGPWKLVSAKSGRWELYNMDDDRTETNDLASVYPDRVEAMAAEWYHIARTKDNQPHETLPPVNKTLTALNFKKDTAKPKKPKTKPFHGKPHAIPGLIEAEDYDLGKPGDAYLDEEEENQGVDYREETQVDIEGRDDASNKHGIGWTRTGEWLIYTVEVKKAGVYRIEMPVASNKKGGVYHIEMNGKDVTGPIDVPDTGGWQHLEMIEAKDVKLEEGTFKMKVVMDSEGPSGSIADIDYYNFIPVE